MEPEVYMGIDPKRSSKQDRGEGKPGRDLREKHMPQEPGPVGGASLTWMLPTAAVPMERPIGLLAFSEYAWVTSEEVWRQIQVRSEGIRQDPGTLRL